MTWLHTVLLLLTGGAGLVAFVASRRDLRVRPVAWYLWATISLDLARLACRALALPVETGADGLPDVRDGWQLGLRSANAGLYVASILALPALARAVFVRRSIKPVICVGGGLWVIIVASYPALRGDALLAVYDVVELGGLLASLLYLYQWLFGGGRPPPSPAANCTLALIAGSAATAVLPWAKGQTVLEAWAEVVAVNACMMAVVLIQLLQATVASPGRAR